jgi:hypothetical protein
VVLLSLPLPQIHQLYHFNVATGVAASTLRNPTFVRVQHSAAPDPTYVTLKDEGPQSFAPVLLFTAYLKPLDAERRWSVEELWTPGISVGFSLSSPATSFYLGLSSEVVRNVQVAYGVNFARVTKLGLTDFVDPTSNVAPATVQRFGHGYFIGVTFNIDFIKGLFGGGGKSGA